MPSPNWPVPLPDVALTLDDPREGAQGRYAWVRGAQAPAPLLFLPGGGPDMPLAACVVFDGDGLDRAEAVVRFLRARQGRSASDPRVTPHRRGRIARELRAADARADRATYREIAEALHGAQRVAAEKDWRSSPLRTEAIDLVAGGQALIAGSYRKLLRHRRRS